MDTIRFEQKGTIGSIVLANPPFNRLDLRFSRALREAVHAVPARCQPCCGGHEDAEADAK